MPDDRDNPTEPQPLAVPTAESTQETPICLEVAGTLAPTAADIALQLRNSAAALAQIGLAGAKACFADLMPGRRGRDVLDTVTAHLETALSVGRDATRKAGSVIKDTAQDPETQELVLKGATAAAREFGYMVGGSIGGRIVERIGEKVGDRLLHGKPAAGEEAPHSAQTEAGRDETGDKTG